MRRTSLFLLMMVSCAFALDAAAQDPPSTRPPRDSIRMGSGIPASSGDSIRMEEVDADEDFTVDEEDADTIPRPATGPYARSGGTGPFTVQASGQVAPRPERGEVVWVDGPRRAARADSARAGTGQRVTSGQAARLDTASAGRDTARTGQRVTSSPPARRDTASARPQNPPAARDTARRGGTGTASTQTERTGSTSAPPSTGRARSHTVVAGETFYGIARRYGVTAAQLRALNPDVDMNALEVGDVLRLPAGARDSRASTQPRTQEPSRPAAQAEQPRRGTRSHVVQAGETLYGIARRYGVTVDAIRRANEMETDQVRTGQRLVIPPAN